MKQNQLKLNKFTLAGETLVIFRHSALLIQKLYFTDFYFKNNERTLLHNQKDCSDQVKNSLNSDQLVSLFIKFSLVPELLAFLSFMAKPTPPIIIQ